MKTAASEGLPRKGSAKGEQQDIEEAGGTLFACAWRKAG
jgi:hypothetical protein